MSCREVYRNPWIEVDEHQVITPGGSPGIYGKVHFRNVAVGIVPVDEEGYTWLVGQYRYVTEVYSWEIPMGGGPLGEEPLDSAKRELKEETGLVAKKWEPIFKGLHLSNSVSDEVAESWLARDLVMGESEPEQTEDLQIKRMPLEEAVEMALDGRITDILSVASLMRCRELLGS